MYAFKQRKKLCLDYYLLLLKISLAVIKIKKKEPERIARPGSFQPNQTINFKSFSLYMYLSNGSET